MAIWSSSGEEIAPVNLDGTPKTETAAEDAAESGEGENEQEVAAPAESEQTDGEVPEGENEQEVAVPAASETDAAENPEEGTPRRQSAEENHRRAAERDPAVKAAQDDVIRKMHVIDPATGKPFDSYADYAAAQENAVSERNAEQLRAAGIDPDVINGMIREHPAVKEAMAVTEQAKAAEERAQAAADRAAFETLLGKVTEKFPNVKTAEDLFAWEHYEDFRILVEGGKTPEHAAALLSGAAGSRAAKQAVINNMASKAHLMKTDGNRAGADISDREFDLMRQLHPNISRRDAAKIYRKYGR